MRAAVNLNPATTDVRVLREQMDKTLTAAGWSTTWWLETTPTSGVSTRGPSFGGGALPVRAPQLLATAA